MDLRQRVVSEGDMQRLIYAAIWGKYSPSRSTSGTDPTYPDVSYKIVFADSISLSADTQADIWPNPSGVMEYPSSAELLSIVSSSIQDDAGGSGVDAVFIEGLDGDFNPQSELVILDGTTAVNSVGTYIHVYKVNCLNITTSGTTNAGNISITNDTSGNRLGYILAGDSISKHGQFVIPAGYNGIIVNLEAGAYRSSGTGERRASVDFDFIPLDGGAGDRIIYRTVKLSSSSGSATSTLFTVPFVTGQKVAVVAKATAEASNTFVSVKYGVVLVRDTIDIDSIF